MSSAQDHDILLARIHKISSTNDPGKRPTSQFGAGCLSTFSRHRAACQFGRLLKAKENDCLHLALVLSASSCYMIVRCFWMQTWHTSWPLTPHTTWVITSLPETVFSSPGSKRLQLLTHSLSACAHGTKRDSKAGKADCNRPSPQASIANVAADYGVPPGREWWLRPSPPASMQAAPVSVNTNEYGCCPTELLACPATGPTEWPLSRSSMQGSTSPSQQKQKCRAPPSFLRGRRSQPGSGVRQAQRMA